MAEATRKSGEDPLVIGFTGTRHGMARLQYVRLLSLWDQLPEGVTLHHGDCLGADAQAHKIARSLGFRIILHPPLKPAWRARCDGDEQREPADYLVRNATIVGASDVLYATPYSALEVRRSGTEATIRYARSHKTLVYVIRPDGFLR